MQPAQTVIAILFYSGEPVTFKDLAVLTHGSIESVKMALQEASASLQTIGLVIVITEDSAELRTGKESSEIIDAMRKEELSRDLGKAGLETLSILMYKGASTRADIDYIRGVNSTAILRNLMIRGLVDKLQNPQDQRSFIYRPTHELLAHLGLSKIEDMTDFNVIKNELESFNATRDVGA
jgi:segregation and condensation protein B